MVDHQKRPAAMRGGKNVLLGCWLAFLGQTDEVSTHTVGTYLEGRERPMITRMTPHGALQILNCGGLGLL